MATLKSILLDAINQDLDSNTYDNPILNNADCQNWSDSDKFDWCFDRYMVEVGGYESLEYWFSGIALSGIPISYYEIGKFIEAENLAISITNKFPKHQFAWKVLGAVLKQTGRVNESLT